MLRHQLTTQIGRAEQIVEDIAWKKLRAQRELQAGGTLWRMLWARTSSMVAIVLGDAERGAQRAEQAAARAIASAQRVTEAIELSKDPNSRCVRPWRRHPPAGGDRDCRRTCFAGAFLWHTHVPAAKFSVRRCCFCSDAQKIASLHEAAVAERATNDAVEDASVGSETLGAAGSILAVAMREELELLSQCGKIAELQLSLHDAAGAPAAVLPTPSQHPAAEALERVAMLRTRVQAAVFSTRSSSAVVAAAIRGPAAEPDDGLPSPSGLQAAGSSASDSKRQRQQ